MRLRSVIEPIIHLAFWGLVLWLGYRGAERWMFLLALEKSRAHVHTVHVGSYSAQSFMSPSTPRYGIELDYPDPQGVSRATTLLLTKLPKGFPHVELGSEEYDVAVDVPLDVWVDARVPERVVLAPPTLRVILDTALVLMLATAWFVFQLVVRRPPGAAPNRGSGSVRAGRHS